MTALICLVGFALTYAEEAPEISDQPKVTAYFKETALDDVVVELATAAKVQIIADTSLPDALITLDLKDVPVDEAVEQVALTVGAYWKESRPGRFLVSMATPTAPLFWEFAVTQRYMPRNINAKTLEKVIPSSHLPYVKFDVDDNVISITAPGTLSDRILADMKTLDKPLRQIMVELTVAEINDSDGQDMGFSWNWGKFQSSSGLEAFYTGAVASDFARLRALVSTGKASLKATPKFFAREGESAELTIGQEAFVSILAGNVNFPTAQIQRIKTGVTLKFTAFVGDDNQLTVRLEPEVGDALTELQDTIITNVRSAKTTLTMKSGETVAIGGLTLASTQNNQTKIPLLGDIPIIGGLFRRTNQSSRKTEVVILVTPRLMEAGLPKGDLAGIKP